MIIFAMLLAACASAPVPQSDTSTPPPFTVDVRDAALLTPAPAVGLLVNGEVQTVDSLEIAILKSLPLQVNATVKGSFPDGCTTLASITAVQEGDTTFRIRILTSRLANTMCTQVITPFETTVALEVNGLPAGEYTVIAYDKSATFTFGTDNNVPDTAASACPQPGGGEALQDDAGIGYCFLYPADFQPDTFAGHGTLTLTGPRYGEGPEPLYAWMTIYTDGGASLDEYVAIKLQEASTTGANVQQSELSLGGSRAVMLSGLPGILGYREVYAYRNGAIFILGFSPDEPGSDPRANADMLRLFDRVTRSWVWTAQ
jgi:hypothetical protein